MLIFTRTLVTYARTIFMPRCCLNFQSMRTQAESTYIAHNMFKQIKMEIPWYINRHTLISRKRDGKPRMIGGQFVVVHVGVHQLSPHTSWGHPCNEMGRQAGVCSRVCRDKQWLLRSQHIGEATLNTEEGRVYLWVSDLHTTRSMNQIKFNVMSRLVPGPVWGPVWCLLTLLRWEGGDDSRITCTGDAADGCAWETERVCYKRII